MELNTKVHFELDQWFFVIFMILTGILLLSQFDFFISPHNDFIQFSQAAEDWLSLKGPSSFKILPAYPLAIAVFSLLIHGKNALLYSAEVLSLISALVFLFFFWKLTRIVIPRTAGLLLLFVVINPYFMEFSLQTLMAMFLLAIVTITIYLVAKDGKGQFFFASIASLTRYDAVFLLPLQGILHYLKGKNLKRSVAVTSLFSLPFIIWMIFSVLNSRFLNPYIAQMKNIHDSMAAVPLLLMLGRMIMGEPPQGSAYTLREEILAMSILVTIIVGWILLYKKKPYLAIITGGFVLSYFSVHAIFKAANYRYNYPIIPFLMMLFFVPIEKALVERKKHFSVLHLIIFIGLGSVFFIVLSDTLRITHVKWMFAFAIVAVSYIAAHFVSRQSLKGSLVASMIWLLTLLCLWPQLRVWQRSYTMIKWRFSEYMVLAKWSLIKGVKVAVPDPGFLKGRLSSSSISNLVATGQFKSTEADKFIKECIRKGIHYVAWVSRIKGFGRNNWFHLATRGYLLNEMGLGMNTSTPFMEKVATLSGGPGHWAFVYKINGNTSGDSLLLCIDMNKEWIARSLMDGGWCVLTEGTPGSRYVWAVGKKSRFHFFLNKHDTDYLLSFKAYPLHPPGFGAQKIRIFVNGKICHVVTLEDREKVYSVNIPHIFLKSGRNNFLFLYSYCASPSNYSNSKDRRCLSVLFKWIRLDPS